jgi:hypothetical protein
MKSKNITVYILALLFVLSLLEIYFIINLKIELEDMIYLEKENAKLCKLTCDLTDHEGSLYTNGNCYCLKYGVWLKYW